MGVLAVEPTTWYVMLKAIPEQGPPLHSFIPELSTVLTSTTPGPLAVRPVQEPVILTPLIQMFVLVGLAISGPRAALVGFR
jgi:hypothetical protein